MSRRNKVQSRRQQVELDEGLRLESGVRLQTTAQGTSGGAHVVLHGGAAAGAGSPSPSASAQAEKEAREVEKRRKAEQREKLDKIGMRGSDTCELVFEDCFVPEGTQTTPFFCFYEF